MRIRSTGRLETGKGRSRTSAGRASVACALAAGTPFLTRRFSRCVAEAVARHLGSCAAVYEPGRLIAADSENGVLLPRACLAFVVARRAKFSRLCRVGMRCVFKHILGNWRRILSGRAIPPFLHCHAQSSLFVRCAAILLWMQEPCSHPVKGRAMCSRRL